MFAFQNHDIAMLTETSAFQASWKTTQYPGYDINLP